jgi:hypothetical protein
MKIYPHVETTFLIPLVVVKNQEEKHIGKKRIEKGERNEKRFEFFPFPLYYTS